MKKWLIRCLTVLAMVCLIPGIVLNVKAADSIYTYCFVCMQQRNYEILEYIKFDSTKHRDPYKMLSLRQGEQHYLWKSFGPYRRHRNAHLHHRQNL